jgi:signal transduction histidine kinase
VATRPSNRITAEQAALRRVATLVARGVPPEELFAAVTREVGVVLGVDFTSMSRYQPAGGLTVVGAWSRTGAPVHFPVGTRLPTGGPDLHTRVFQTGQPARFDIIAGDLGPAMAPALAAGIRASVGVPISVEGQLWGVIIVSSTVEEPLPADTEARLAGFIELAAIAIANAQARVELRRFAEEQAALRRVATLVARGAPPEQVFSAVTEEAGRVLGADYSAMARYDPDGAITNLGVWTSIAFAPLWPVGGRMELGGRNVVTRVFETGRPTRIDHYADATGAGGDFGYAFGLRSAVGVPVSVEGRLWGAMIVFTTHDEPLPGGTEERLADFTELAATALANAEAQAAVTASRARIVATADATRRRIERDLHDGAQQRLVSLALQLRTAQAAVPPDAGDLAGKLGRAAAELTEVLDELREIAHGIHPAILADGGLKPALKALARRSAVSVRLNVRVDGRLPEPIEIAAYYAVAEALTNTAKHASAARIHVEGEVGEGVLRIEVRDDGCGGATFAHGSGLVGLKDRVEALGGQLSLRSPPGAGTTMTITLPLDDGSKTRPPRQRVRRPENAEPAADPDPPGPPRES